jgi:predicted  nucleic acid-binding Zn-ribbon protein
MGATLDALHRLQEIELQIAEVRRGIDGRLRAARKQEARMVEIDADIAARQAALRSEQIEADRLDLDVKSREADIARLRQALNAAKTNKEYSAILAQLNTSKADNSKVEERVLALLTQIDAKRKEITALQETRAHEGARLAELQAAVRKAEDQSRNRLVALQALRDEAAAAVPEKALDCFSRVARKNDGEAMARVIRTNPKRAEYACDGCNMAITIEQVNAIMSRDEAITCNTCGRILYIDAPATSGLA